MIAGQVQTQNQPRVKPTTLVYWLRVVMAVLAGLTNEILHIDQVGLGDLAQFAGIALGVVFFLLSVFIVRRVLHYGETELKGKNKDITLGGGSFIVMWVVVTVLLYTVFH